MALVLRSVDEELFLSVCQIQGGKTQSAAYVRLVSGVDVHAFEGFHQVVGTHHEAVRYDTLCLELRFAQEGGLFVFGRIVIVIWSNLDVVEGKFSLSS